MKSSRLTSYRAAVLETLRSTNTHPTAAEIFRKVRRRRPGVSYATIYNSLDWLTRNGMASELKFGDAASRYDPIMSRHDHLVCTRCGALRDHEIALSPRVWSRAGRPQGFHVERYRMELYGLCSRCSSQGTRKATD
jgi:Fur family peroxide stress response transcriptional regulator